MLQILHQGWIYCYWFCPRNGDPNSTAFSFLLCRCQPDLALEHWFVPWKPCRQSPWLPLLRWVITTEQKHGYCCRRSGLSTLSSFRPILPSKIKIGGKTRQLRWAFLDNVINSHFYFLYEFPLFHRTL